MSVISIPLPNNMNFFLFFHIGQNLKVNFPIKFNHMNFLPFAYYDFSKILQKLEFCALSTTF